MKTNKIYAIAIALGLQFGTAAHAESLTENAAAASETAVEKVSLKVPNFARPLVEKLASEYKKENRNVEIEFVSAKAQNSQNTVQLTTNSDDAVAFARYAVLPVTTKGSEADQVLSETALNAKKLKNLFFVKDELDDERKETKAEKLVHVYTGNSQQSASRAYAAHFEHEASDYKGKKISGDDSYLNTAISRDPQGVTINSLSNIFDLQSRQVRQELSIVPLDLGKQGKQVLSEGDLDKVLALLEKQEFDEVPVANVGLDFDHQSKAARKFAAWVLSHGSEFVHQYGLLLLSQKELSAQAKRAQETNENSNILACL